MEHSYGGMINCTTNHGGESVCLCQKPKNPPLDMPDKCQAELLVEWMKDWYILDRNGIGAKHARYEARRVWALNMGIFGIRVDLPACVKKLILERFGAGSSTFVAGKNNCPCKTCENYRAEQEVTLA